MKKLPADIKAKWLEALRSGRYQQGRAILRSPDNNFCCLGVLCDIIDPEKWDKTQLNGAIHPGLADVWGVGYCYPDIQLMYNINSDVSETLNSLDDGRKSVMGIVSSMNDMGRSFAEIATWIEENL